MLSGTSSEPGNFSSIMADQLVLFYFVLTFGIGLISLGIVAVAHLRVKETVLEYYLYFYGVFSISLVADTVISYLVANFSEIPSDEALAVTLNYANMVTTCVLLFIFPLFAHELFACSHRSRRNRVLGGFAVGSYLFYHAQIAIFCIWEKRFPALSLVLDLYLTAVVFYCTFLSFQYYRLSKQQPRRRNAGIILLFFLGAAGAILDDELLGTIPFPVYPLAYAGFGLIFGAYFFSLYWPKHQVVVEPPVEKSLEPIALSNRDPDASLSQRSDQSNSFDEFCQQFELSSREAEVLLLLLQGQTNNQIAECLFISINTVKTHISNIYQKIGVSRRYELLARCKDFSFRS